MNTQPATTLDPEEVARFTALAEEWWDETGKFAPLHRINPVRLKYIRARALEHFCQNSEFRVQSSEIAPFQGYSALDIGCGGGLVAEPLTRMGFAVTGIDAGEKNVCVARLHAEASGLEINYRTTTAEALAELTGNLQSEQVRGGDSRGGVGEDSPTQYNLVLALEIIEHVADVGLFLQSCAALVKPGGMLVLSTLNRTVKAYALAIIGAEVVLRWLPRGTHDWKKFLKPHEIVQPLQKHGLELVQMQGLVLNPLKRQWEMSLHDCQVNYMVVLRKLT